jgi:phage tail P2-like protein
MAARMNKSLLPPNATKLERDLETVNASVFAGVPVNIVNDFSNPDKCPVEFLPRLAIESGVDDFNDTWAESAKRQTIKDSMTVHRRKGTVWAIKRVIANAGFGGSTIVEGAADARYDGTYFFNGNISYGDRKQWATYRVIMNRPVSNAQAVEIKKMLKPVAPARCKLVEFRYDAAACLYDGTIKYDASFNFGSVNG